MTFSRTTISALLLALLAAACASTSDMRGDMTRGAKRQLHYTCRLQTGEVIVTTNPEVAEKLSTKKARLFARKDQYGPRPVTADDESQGTAQEMKELRFFEEVLIDKLSRATRRWKTGTAGTVHVTAEEQMEVPEQERTIWLSRLKTVSKEARYEKETFESMTGSRPEVDEGVFLQAGIKGKVVSVEENEVVVRFMPVSTEPMEGRFGSVTVHDKGDHYEIETDAVVGTLVRVGPLVGRIAEIRPKTFRMDYSHPFGGETLLCDVRVEAVPGDVSEKTVAQMPEEITTQARSMEDPFAARRATAAGPALSGSAGGDEKAAIIERQACEEENRNMVQAGDLVQTAYTASLETGEVFRTTDVSVVDSPDTRKVDWYQAPEAYGPETIVVGEKASVPGLGNAVLGLGTGETRTVVLPPNMAYGARDVKWVGEFERIRSFPTTTVLSAEDYVKRYGGLPAEGRVLAYNSYLTGRVINVGDKSMILELSPRVEKDVSSFGTTEVRVVEDKIEVFLIPEIGGLFPYQGRIGRIISAGHKTFTVDFNHPMAGKNFVLDVEVVSLTKASELKGLEIDWMENHDKALVLAKKNGKPVVLVLYAEWCTWCKRYLSETLQDTRIRMLKDAFVWVKINSDVELEYKDFYEVKGFPMTVLLNPEGGVIKKLEGYKDAATLMRELDNII